MLRTWQYLHHIASHYNTLHDITLHYVRYNTHITIHYITLHYITLQSITLYYITLHYMTLQHATIHGYRMIATTPIIHMTIPPLLLLLLLLLLLVPLQSRLTPPSKGPPRPSRHSVRSGSRRCYAPGSAYICIYIYI